MRDRFPWILTALYALIFTVLGIQRYDVHRNLVDFGIFEQTVASAFGCFCNTIEGSHWAIHFSPILYVVGALVAIWKSPFVLITSQAVACALVIPPVYALANRSKMAAVIAFLYPALAGLTFGDFHENGFAPAAVAWTIWAYDAGRLPLAAIFATLALLVKEDQAIFMGAAAAFVAWRDRGTRRGNVGAFVSVVAVLIVGLFFVVIAPHANANPHWAPTRFYSWTSAEFAHIFPGGILERLGFVVLAFLPLLFLPFRTRAGWLLALPLAEVLLSSMSTTYTMGTHYAGAWLGYALAAFAIGWRSIDVLRIRVIGIACASLCVVELAVANPMHPRLNLRGYEPRDRILDSFSAVYADIWSVATQEEAYTHLALDHPNVTLLPESPDQVVTACVILVDHDFPDSPRLVEYGPALEPYRKRLLETSGQPQTGPFEVFSTRDCRR